MHGETLIRRQPGRFARLHRRIQRRVGLDEQVREVAVNGMSTCRSSFPESSFRPVRPGPKGCYDNRPDVHNPSTVAGQTAIKEIAHARSFRQSIDGFRRVLGLFFAHDCRHLGLRPRALARLAQQLPPSAGRRRIPGRTIARGDSDRSFHWSSSRSGSSCSASFLQGWTVASRAGAGTMATGRTCRRCSRNGIAVRTSAAVPAVFAAALTANGQRDRPMPAQTIFVVEDEPRIAAIAADYLRHAGYR